MWPWYFLGQDSLPGARAVLEEGGTDMKRLDEMMKGMGNMGTMMDG